MEMDTASEAWLVANIESSVVATVGYDPCSKDLYVEFKKGGLVWRYLDVPRSTYQEFLSAPSAGRYLAGIKRSYEASEFSRDEWVRMLASRQRTTIDALALALYERNAEWLDGLRSSDLGIAF